MCANRIRFSWPRCSCRTFLPCMNCVLQQLMPCIDDDDDDDASFMLLFHPFTGLETRVFNVLFQKTPEGFLFRVGPLMQGRPSLLVDGGKSPLNIPFLLLFLFSSLLLSFPLSFLFLSPPLLLRLGVWMNA